ncbi:MAG: hypothetical protein U9R42_14240 [Bacteroidota bacterium]|nr:hypothetical protein [Bacteroidota bacterium]
MAKKINKASTKKDLLEAYNELQDKLNEESKEDVQKTKEQSQKAETIKTASSLSPEKIIKGTANLKSTLNGTLDNLEETLTEEYKKLSNLQTAIDFEKNNLEELYEIKISANSLIALAQTHQEKIETFEKESLETENNFNAEIKNKREQWEKEIKKTENEIKEKKAENEKQRKREDEEYKYELALKRKKEENTYQEKKAVAEKQMIEKQTEFDKAIAERESNVAKSENELEDLRKQVDNFPSELEKSVKDTEKALSEKLKSQYDFEKQLAQKHVEGELNLKNQTISSLQARIKELENNVKELNTKTVNAETSVKDIAIKAIEGASKLSIIEGAKRKEDKE